MRKANKYRFIWAQDLFQRCKSMVGWLHCFRPETKKKYHGGRLWQRKLLTSWQLGSREEEGAHPSDIHPPMRLHLPIMSCYETVKGLMH
jgi:hypothetical protein